jgi:hypothetical protein
MLNVTEDRVHEMRLQLARLDSCSIKNVSRRWVWLTFLRINSQAKSLRVLSVRLETSTVVESLTSPSWKRKVTSPPETSIFLFFSALKPNRRRRRRRFAENPSLQPNCLINYPTVQLSMQGFQCLGEKDGSGSERSKIQMTVSSELRSSWTLRSSFVFQ